MSEEKSRWERLTDLPNEYEDNPELAQRVIAIVQSEEPPQKRSWFSLHWKKFTAVAASLVTALVVLGTVFLPKLLSSPEETPTPQIIYYATEEVRVDELTDVPAFVQEKGLPIKYFSLPNTVSKAAVVTATETFAYLQQQAIYIDMTTASFDTLQLRAVVLQNATFDFEEDYEKTKQTINYMDMNISYSMEQDEVENNNPKIFATFAKNGVEYYLEIQTAGDAVEKIQQYVAILLA